MKKQLHVPAGQLSPDTKTPPRQQRRAEDQASGTSASSKSAVASRPGGSCATADIDGLQQAASISAVHQRFGDRSSGDEPPDYLVPDRQVAREVGTSNMGLWRWTRDESLDFPPVITIRGRNFRSRRQLEAWKRRQLDRAIEARTERAADKAMRETFETDAA